MQNELSRNDTSKDNITINFQSFSDICLPATRMSSESQCLLFDCHKNVQNILIRNITPNLTSLKLPLTMSVMPKNRVLFDDTMDFQAHTSILYGTLFCKCIITKKNVIASRDVQINTQIYFNICSQFTYMNLHICPSILISIFQRHYLDQWSLLLIGRLGTNFSKIWFQMKQFLFKIMLLKMSSTNWQPLCRDPGLFKLCRIL